VASQRNQKHSRRSKKNVHKSIAKNYSVNDVFFQTPAILCHTLTLSLYKNYGYQFEKLQCANLQEHD
jgi:hypothetical protein